MTLNSLIHVVYDKRAIKSTTNTRFTCLFVRYIWNYSWSMLRQLKMTCTNSNRTFYCHEKTMECSRNNVHFYFEEQQQQMTWFMTSLWHHYDFIYKIWFVIYRTKTSCTCTCIYKIYNVLLLIEFRNIISF